MESVNCNNCLSDQTNLIGTFHDLVYKNPGNFVYVCCQNCGLIYLQLRPTPQEMGLFYPPDYRPYRPAIQTEQSSLIRWARNRNQQRRINIIEQFSPKSPGRLLDVGCSTGIFLDAVRKKSWQVNGIDLNKQAVDYARSYFNLEVFEGQLQNASYPAHSFEVITFWDVLEHTFSPIENLKKGNLLLCSDGIIVITIPQWESLDRKIFGHHWIGYDAPRHLFVFPQLVLKAMLAESGFEIIQFWSGLDAYYTFLASLRPWLKARIVPERLRNVIIRFLEFPGVRLLLQPFFSLVGWFGWAGKRVIVAKKSRDLNIS